MRIGLTNNSVLSFMKGMKKIPWEIRIIILVSYLIPFVIFDTFAEEGIRDMRWFFYLVPVFFFAYYFGLRGGLISSFFSNAFFLLWEWGETLMGLVRPHWETYLIFAIALVSFSIAIGIGLLANKLSLLSNIDPLTNLFNRRYINDYQLKKNRATVLFVDLDRFKFINDSLGHRIGDKILQFVSDRLKENTGENDIVARLGGDEFVIILYEVEMNKIKQKAGEILQSLSIPFFNEENEIYLTASIGISQCPEHSMNLSELIAKADIAMYRAKQQGKFQFQFYSEDMDAENKKRLELERDLHKAVEEQEFVIYYQPRLDLKTNVIIGMEALVRWQHPYKGLIPPVKFISITEETGLIVPIGEWVLYNACKQNQEWQEAGFSPLRVSVNISARQFQNNLVATVKRILDQTGLDPQWLELEITESMLMNNVEDSVQILHQLKNLGVYLSIDDFGTGYSSLNYLKQFPVDCLKIDKSFVNDILSEASITKGIIMLGHSLNLEVIAEGIEKQEQATALLKEDCNQGQGYLFSKPVPKQEFEDILTSNTNSLACE